MMDAIKKAWHGFRKFGLFMASVVNFVLLLIVYIIGVGLTALIGKLFRKSFLDLKKNKPEWIIKKEQPLTIAEYQRPF